MSIKFQWDQNKANINLKKHKISFEEACTVFNDPLAQIFDDEDHSKLERREIIIGHSVRDSLLLVCFVERTTDIIRIFSARAATKKEREDYEKNNI
jgi:uncharacterized DUF497 family protein